jgi:hypothetical protein
MTSQAYSEAENVSQVLGLDPRLEECFNQINVQLKKGKSKCKIDQKLEAVIVDTSRSLANVTTRITALEELCKKILVTLNSFDTDGVESESDESEKDEVSN